MDSQISVHLPGKFVLYFGQKGSKSNSQFSDLMEKFFAHQMIMNFMAFLVVLMMIMKLMMTAFMTQQ